MKDQVEQINGRSVVNAVLVAEFDALEATVVTAMGITKSEKSLSYNVQETKLENVTPTGSFVNSLNGKVAGHLQVSVVVHVSLCVVPSLSQVTTTPFM